jgi:thiamine-phosphate diphosphorylase
VSQRSSTDFIEGVTIVQYRNKNGSAADMLKEATALLQITRRHNVPLIINDRVDVALESGADGVHIGQDDAGTWLRGTSSWMLT